MNQAEKYLIESLAGSGIAILSGFAARMLRPDLIEPGFEPRVLESGRLMQLRTRIPRFSVRFEGRPDSVDVLARSGESLKARIEWLTGLSVTSIEAAIAESSEQVILPREIVATDPSGDRYVGIRTNEPGRKCAECANYTAGFACTAQAVSGVQRPHGGVNRRCLGFTPLFDSYDSRSGSQLWPELLQLDQKV